MRLADLHIFWVSVVRTTCTLSTAHELDMQALVDQKLTEMGGMTDAFFTWLRRDAPPHVARGTLLGFYCRRAIALAEDESVELTDRLNALLRYQREETEFVASQPRAMQPLIQGPTLAEIAQFKKLLAERQRAVAVEQDALQRAGPKLLREREQLFERMAPMTPTERAAEVRLLKECAALLRGIPHPTPEQTPADVLRDVLARPDAYDTSEFERKITS